MLRIANENDCAELEQLLSDTRVSVWTAMDLNLFLAAADGFILVAEAESHAAAASVAPAREIIGLLLCRIMGQDGEILNFAVRDAQRGQGIGTHLLTAAKQRLVTRGVERVFLEVRASNAGAQKIYRAHGFTFCGQRKNYYCQPTEDALLMRLDL